MGKEVAVSGNLFREIFPQGKLLIGVIHLPPLPGSPRHGGGTLGEIIERGLRDLRALEEGGADGAIVENFGDRPFPKRAPVDTVAAMAVVARELAREARIPLGINILRSDGEAALAVAAAAEASFIRVNVFCGVAFTDQGIIEGRAREIVALRRRLGAGIAILADIHVKHAHHFGTLREAARDAARNLADALIVTGSGTGETASPPDIEVAREASGLPVLVGSGIAPDNLAAFSRADGFIVGTYLKRGGEVEAPVDVSRVRRLREALDSLDG